MGNSNGLAWALSMFGLDLVELLALLEVVFVDPLRQPNLAASGFLRVYFVISATSFALQLAGIVLVALGLYRLGGIIQIVSSSVHVPKGEGIIGVVGGVKAYRYAEEVAAESRARNLPAATDSAS